MEQAVRTFTMDEIENADWDISTNVTDHAYPTSMDDSQLVYKSYQTTIDGHAIHLTYSDEQGREVLVDGEPWSGLVEDMEDSEVFDTVADLLDDDYTDLDEIRTECKWRLADPVESYEKTDNGGHTVMERIEVRSYEDPTTSRTVYIAKKEECPDYQEAETEIIDDYDFESIKSYLRSDVEDWYFEQAREHFEEEGKELVDEDRLNEAVEKLVEFTMNYADTECEGAYLQYYYEDSEDEFRKGEALSSLCYDFIEGVNWFEDCFAEVKDDEE